jgi:hypothetical protein
MLLHVVSSTREAVNDPIIFFVRFFSARPTRMADEPRAKMMTDVLGDVSKTFKPAGFSLEAYERGRRFQPREDDVIIATAPKSGTTWLQWVVLMLRSGAQEPEWPDMYCVSPWINFAWDYGIDPDEAQGHPRVYKSHERLQSVQRGAKYIVTVRRPDKVAVSWYNFLKAKGAPVTSQYDGPDGFVDDAEYWTQGMRFGANLYEYYVEYYRCRECADVLCLPFEDLVDDLHAHLPVIANFIGIDQPTDALLEAVARLSSKEAMLRHESRLDESWTYAEVLRLGRNPKPESWTPAARVTAGGGSLSAAACAKLDQQWADGVTAVLPELHSYEDLVKGCREALCRRFPQVYRFKEC